MHLQYLYNFFSSEIEDNLPLDCFTGSVYYILKAKYPWIRFLDVLHLFIGDLSIAVEVNNNTNSIQSISNPTDSLANFPKQVIETTRLEYIRTGKESLFILEELLKKEGTVLLMTEYQFLPFSTMYNPEFNAECYEFPQFNHAMNILGYDQDNFYYQDISVMLNKNAKPFIPEKENISKKFNTLNPNIYLGMCKKSEMLEALSLYMYCHIVSVNKDLLTKPYNEKIINNIEISLSYHNKENLLLDNSTIYYGINALSWIAGILDSNQHNFDSLMDHKDINKTLVMPINSIINCRNLFYLWLENTKGFKDKNQKLIEDLKSCITNWIILRSLINKKCVICKDYSFNSRYVSRMQDIIKDEEKVLYGLSSLSYNDFLSQ